MADKEGTSRTAKAIVVCTTPDVCKTPMGSSMVPVPYQIVAKFDASTATVATVRMSGAPTFVLKSRIAVCTGDEPGVGGGIKSGTIKGVCEPIDNFVTVRAMSSGVVRDTDPFWMNNRNTVGRAVFPVSRGPVESEHTEQDKGFWHQVGGAFRGAGKALWEMGEAVVTVVTDPGKVAEGLGAAIDDPGAAMEAMSVGYTEAWAAGEYGEALGRGAVDIGSLFLGGVGVVAKGGKGAAAAGQVAKATDTMGDVGRVAKATDAAADAAQLANVDKNIARGSKFPRSGNTGTTVSRYESMAVAPYYPPNDGFLSRSSGQLRKGEKFQRYGSDGGTFAAPAGTPKEALSLPPQNTGVASNWEVLESIPVDKGPAAPWFGQPGGGTQYQLPMSIKDLEKNGFIRRIP